MARGDRLSLAASTSFCTRNALPGGGRLPPVRSSTIEFAVGDDEPWLGYIAGTRFCIKVEMRFSSNCRGFGRTGDGGEGLT